MNFDSRFWDKEATTEKCGIGRQLFFREIELTEIINEIKENQSQAMRPLKIIDLGCGNGMALKRIKQECPNNIYYGIDFSKEMIKNAKQNLIIEKVNLGVQNIKALKFKNNSFDLAFTIRVIVNLKTEKEKKQAINEIERILTPVGTAVLCEISQDGFDNLNKLLKSLNLRALKKRWGHNVFFTKKIEKYMVKKFARVFFFQYPFTSLLKHIPESFLSCDEATQATRSERQKEIFTLTNHISRFSIMIDHLLSGSTKRLSRHMTYVLCKSRGW